MRVLPWLLPMLCLTTLATGAGAAVTVEVRGLEGEEKESVEARLGTVLTGTAVPDDALIRRLHRQAEDDIRTALQAYGYYRPVIDGELLQEGQGWRAVYIVDPGVPTRMQSVEIELIGPGQHDPELQALARQPPLRVGERLIHAEYEQTKRLLTRAAYRNGYLDAIFVRRELRVHPDREAAEALLSLDTGPRYYIGPVHLEQDALRDEFVQRYIKLEPGQPFDPERVLQTQFTLTDLDYFSSVEVEPRRSEAVDEHIPIYIRLKPRPPRRDHVGAGYGTDTGARIRFGTEFRRLNRRGHKARANTLLAERINELALQYQIPLGDLPGESLGFNAAASQDKQSGTVESRKYQLGAVLSRQLGDWQRRLYVNFEHEESIFQDRQDQSDLLIPGASLSRGDHDPIYAREGWFGFLDVHGTHPALLSNTSFLQTRLLLRAALPVGARGRLLGRVESGASFVDEFSELPASQRFFAGGEQSVRGYAYQSLGPRDENGTVIGGEYLLTTSIELEYLFWRNWGAAIFHDAGNAYDDPNTDLFRSVGLGLRWRAPIGVLQLDLAHPLDDPERDLRVHLGIRVGL